MPAIAPRHGLLDGIEPTKAGPIDEVAVPFRAGTGSIEGRFPTTDLKSVVGSVPDIAAQGIGVAVVPSGGHESRDGRRRPVRQCSAACRFAGPVGHTS